MYAVCWRVLGNAADAQDALQEAALSFLGALDGFRSEAKLASFAHRVAYHAAVDLRRRREVRRATSLDELRACHSDESFDIVDDEIERPPEELFAR